MRATSVLRHSPWDGTLVALAFAHGAVLSAIVFAPLPPPLAASIVAVGLWWNANTISHNFIHLPFFRSLRMNGLFSLYLTLLLGFPQHLWRARHLAHHVGNDHAPVKWTTRICAEAAIVLLLWSLLLIYTPAFFLRVYLPGYFAGLALCQLQGHFEHAHETTSHYGKVYNTLFFRDGFHVEHHATPGVHWTRLRPLGFGAAGPRLRPLGFGAARPPRGSYWPPVLRWLDQAPAALDALERIVLRSTVLQSVVLSSHQLAIERSIVGLSGITRVVIIGGGLFPRTAIIIRRLLPDAAITIIDRNPGSLKSAQRFVGASVTAIEGDCDAFRAFDADLVIVPLAFIGDREAFYENPPAPFVIVHDWIWRRRGEGTRVSWWLLKRVNLVRRSSGVTRRPSARRTIPRRAA